MTPFERAVETVYSYIRRKNTLDTERPARTLAVLKATGNPQAALPVIHVTGTKGKGSTCAMLAAALQASGCRVGLYTSPHLHSIRERIQVNGTPIPEAAFIAHMTRLKPHFDAVPGIGFPEVMTCLAFHHFAAQSVDFAVIEVHLGGRYDSTNVITPVCAAITTIDYDHVDILGGTLTEIARQKAGIIKPGVPVVSARQHADARAVITAEAQRQGAPLTLIGDDVPLHVQPMSRAGQSIVLDGERYDTNLIGAHQGENLAVAVAVLKQLGGVDMTQVAAGLRAVVWGGRLEVVGAQPTVILDIAHNHAAAVTLRRALDALFLEQPRVFVYGSKENKDVRAILAALLRPDDTLILTASDDPPTAPPNMLAAAAPEVKHLINIPSVAGALTAARAVAGEAGLICVTGSIFVVAAARAI